MYEGHSEVIETLSAFSLQRYDETLDSFLESKSG